MCKKADGTFDLEVFVWTKPAKPGDHKPFTVQCKCSRVKSWSVTTLDSTSSKVKVQLSGR